MLTYIFLTFFYGLICLALAAHNTIEKETKAYFYSESINRCKALWPKYRYGFEDAISKALTDYGKESLNLYIKRPIDTLLLTKGYYHSDGQVEMVFQEMVLEKLPHIIDPELEFKLCSNFMKIKTLLSPMIIHAPYMLFRNKKYFIYDLNEQKTKNSSPFRFPQVKNTGSITITADMCVLTGGVLLMMDGSSVTVKHSRLELRHCHFDIEIFVPWQRTPPVIADYLFDDHGIKLQDLLTRTVNRELLPQLQAAFFAYVNTSAVFGEKHHKMERQVKSIFEKTEQYAAHVVREIKSHIIKRDLGIVRMKDFIIKWDDSFDGQKKNCSITLKDMTLSGIENAYAAEVGGPFKLGTVRIMENVKISSMQVIGKVELNGLNDNGVYKFAADIYDASIDVVYNVDILKNITNGKTRRDPFDHEYKSYVLVWREIDFSCPGAEDLPIESIVTGYLLSALPKYIIEPLRVAYRSALNSRAQDFRLDYIDSHSAGDDNELSEKLTAQQKAESAEVPDYVDTPKISVEEAFAENDVSENAGRIQRRRHR